MPTSYEKLSALLKELFQLGQADLDFGIYRIMNQKRDEITRFLDTELLPQVKTAFDQYRPADKKVIEGEIQKAVQGAEALGVDPNAVPKVKELREQLANYSVDTGALENEVFSHLYSFFRRYYDNGDFISMRRYKEGVYAIPYEGEEVKLHWANADQYYVKTTENFRDYSFRLPSGRLAHFKIVEAETEKDNVKADNEKERRFILAPENPIAVEGDALILRFEYRSDPEKRDQKTLSTLAAETILAGAPAEWVADMKTLTPTAMEPQLPTEQPPAPLQGAFYTYDGDGNLVKSVVNGTTTYYPSTIYQEEISGSTTKVTKYYNLGGQKVAMRTSTGGSSTLSWLITDHLGSTNVTANADGSLESEIRYRPFGETRYTNGITPTDYRYTGQLNQPELGLYFYVSRWYDPQLGRFIQADTVVPGAGNPGAYDRYAYVLNNPINLTDPFGHGCRRNLGAGHFSEMDCPEDAWSYNGDPATGEEPSVNIYQQTISAVYNITTTGGNWTKAQAKELLHTLEAVDAGIDKFTGGKGLNWINNNWGGSSISTGSNDPITEFNNQFFNGRSHVIGSHVFMSEGFQSNRWAISDGGGDAWIAHEFTHVWDNRTSILSSATIIGGGAGDVLMDLVGGESTAPFGLRFTDNSLQVREGFEFPPEPNWNYGNSSPADYFANTFVAAVLFPEKSNVPQISVSFMRILIQLTSK